MKVAAARRAAQSSGGSVPVALFGLAFGIALTSCFALGIVTRDRANFASIVAFSGLVSIGVTRLASHSLGLARASGLSLVVGVALSTIAALLAMVDVENDLFDEGMGSIVAAILVPVPFAVTFAIATPLVKRFLLLEPARSLALARACGRALLVLVLAAAALGARKRAAHPPLDASLSIVDYAGGLSAPHADEQEQREEGAPLVGGGASLHLRTDAVERVCTIDVNDTSEGVSSLRYTIPKRHGAGICSTLHVWRVRSERAWIVGILGEIGPMDTQGFAGAGLSHGTSRASFARALAPPLAWILSPLLGVAVALAALAPRDRRLRDLLTWREQTRDGVPVLVSPRVREPGYRDNAGALDPSMVVDGTHATVREELLHRALGRWLFALASLVLTSAPLLTAVAMGFGT